jgi:hypothetical protein
MVLRGLNQSLNGIVAAGGMDGLRTADKVKKLITGLENDFDQGLQSIVGIRQYWGMTAQNSMSASA